MQHKPLEGFNLSLLYNVFILQWITNVEPEARINYTKIFNPSIQLRVTKLTNSLSSRSRRGKESLKKNPGIIETVQ